MRSSRNYFLLLLLPSFHASFAFAQTSLKTIDATEIFACSSKTNSIERLACFDNVARKLGPTTEQAIKNVGEWRVSTDVSKFDDTKSVYLFLKAKNAISGWPGKSYTPELTIRCKEKKTEAYITFGMSPTVESGLYNSATIQLRVDKQPPFKAIGTKSTDGDALFMRDAISFAKKLYNATELLVRFIPFNSSAQETSFNISGLEQAISPLSETCKWPK